MMMKQIGQGIEEKIRLLGQCVLLKGTQGDQETRAIIDPVHSVSENARSISSLPDGYFPPGSYQYFGLPEADLTEVHTVVAGGKTFFLRRKERYEAAGEGLYWWALMIRGGSEDAGA